MKTIDFLDTTIYKGTNFRMSQKLDIKVILKKQTRMHFYIKQAFTQNILLKDWLNHN